MKQFFEIIKPDGSTFYNRVNLENGIQDYENVFMPLSCNNCELPATDLILKGDLKEVTFLCSNHYKHSKVNIIKKAVNKGLRKK